MDKPIVEIKSLRHIYQDKTEVRAEGMPFLVHLKERVVLIGATGTGKTTLLRHVLGLLKPSFGEVRVLGRDPHREFNSMRQEIGAVFQNPDEQIIGPTVYDDIAFTLRAHRLPKEEVEQRVQVVAANLGLSHLLGKVPQYLSGGQKQKVALAGAVVTEPSLLVLDEPFSGLDSRSRQEMIALLKRLNEERGTAMIISTHDLEIVPQIADTVYVLHHGHLVMAGTPADVLTEVEGLRAADLEPPLLVQLFWQLKQAGLVPSIPVGLAASEELLIRGLKV